MLTVSFRRIGSSVAERHARNTSLLLHRQPLSRVSPPTRHDTLQIHSDARIHVNQLFDAQLFGVPNSWPSIPTASAYRNAEKSEGRTLRIVTNISKLQVKQQASRTVERVDEISSTRQRIGPGVNTSKLCDDDIKPATVTDAASQPASDGDSDKVETIGGSTEQFEHVNYPRPCIKRETSHSSATVVARFQKTLQLAFRSPDHDRLRECLLDDYRFLKKKDPGIIKVIPVQTWQHMWRVQSSFRPSDPMRLQHMGELVRDMQAGGLKAEHELAVMKLEEMWENGQREEAMSQWAAQSAHGSIRQEDWLWAGSRLHATAGELDRAYEMLDRVLKTDPSVDFRFVLYSICSHAESTQAQTVRNGWSLYQQLYSRAFFKLKTDDYTAIFMSFLKNDKRRVALQILKDMATTKSLPDPQCLQQVLTRNIEELHESCTQLKFLHYVSLEALGFFPKYFDRSGFFKTWLENTSRFLRPPVDPANNCAQIIELMFESGHTPSAVHLNVLIRVWFLMGKPEEARSMAWRMINKRMAHAEELRDRIAAPTQTSNGGPENFGAKECQWIPKWLERPVPCAVVQTFTLLADHYARTNQLDHAHHVLELMSAADLSFEKRSLRAVLNSHLISGNPWKAWDLFTCTETQDKRLINLYTYNTLWKGCLFHLRAYRKVNRHVKRLGFWRRLESEMTGVQYPNSRQLFAQTLNFILTQHVTESVPERVPPNLYDRIIGVFMHAGDPVGAVVVMETLTDVLNLKPTVSTIETLVYYTALASQQAEAKQGSTKDIKQYQRMAEGVIEQLFINADVHDGEQPNISKLYDGRFAKERGGDLMAILCRYLKKIMTLYWGHAHVVDVYLKNARRRMGVDKGRRDHACWFGRRC